MPQNKSGRGKLEATTGGTAVDGAGRSTLVAVGLLLAVVAIVLVLGRDGEKKILPTPESSANSTNTTTTSTGATTTRAPNQEPEVVGFQVDESIDQAQGRKNALASALQERLAKQRLWSTVRIDRVQDTLIIVSSSACQEPGMKATLTGAAAELREAGLTTLRCVEKHGGLVYEQTL